MTVEELSELLQLHGWYLDMMQRYKTRYAYAKRRVGKQVQTRYLKSENKLNELSPENVLERIQSNAPGDAGTPPGATLTESL